MFSLWIKWLGHCIFSVCIQTGVSAFFGNTYNATGNYTYNVTVANLVSSKTAVVYFPVQIPITNYSIIQPGVIAFDEVEKVYFKMDSGSHVELDGTFSGTSLFNMRYIYIVFVKLNLSENAIIAYWIADAYTF